MEESRDYRSYATRAITPTMEAFSDFLIEKVYAGTLPEGIDEASFRRGVALGGSTRGYFQSSDEWKRDPRNYLVNVDARRAAKAEETRERAVKAAARVAARLAKAEATLAALRAAASETDADAEEIAAEGGDSTVADETDDGSVERADADANAANVERAEEGKPEVPTPANVAKRGRRAA